MGPYQRTLFSKLLELLDTQIFLGSVQWVLLQISWTRPTSLWFYRFNYHSFTNSKWTKVNDQTSMVQRNRTGCKDMDLAYAYQCEMSPSAKTHLTQTQVFEKEHT